MKNKILLFALFLSISIYGQERYEPEILILAPFSVKYEKDFKEEISKINEKLKEYNNSLESTEYLNSPEFKNQPENIQRMVAAEIEYSKRSNFYNNTSLIAEQFLAYIFFEKFPNLLIELSNKKSNGTREDLEQLAKKKNLQYVLNFPSIRSFKKEGQSYTEVEFQLFDHKQDSILLQEKFIGNSTNPGFEFACEDQSVSCTLNNALSQGLNEILYIIASNSPSLKREKELSLLRYKELLYKHYQIGSKNDFTKEIITNSALRIDSDLYQTLINSDSTKFVAFYIKQGSKQNLKSLNDHNDDNNVTILTDKSLSDKEIFDIPQTYAFIIKGVKFENHWYLDKSNATYFEATNMDSAKKQYFNNLQNWNFFKENSTTFNKDFWNTKLFEKVPDLKKDPEWDEYGDNIWKTEEINNRDYIGLYEIVADNMIEDLEAENDSYEERAKKILQTKYDSLESSDSKNYTKISKHSLIFPKDKEYSLNPVLIEEENGKKTIRYFLLLNNSNAIYEWVYFVPKEVDTNYYGDKVVEQISSLTDWNFSVYNLNDENFWKEYVFKKENEKYIYLRKVN
ncbi:hypothetical protein RM545_07685 [Zunongwangia sp. F260]|uniref:Uncharacterized protein n=1 Tax=Autumnicola lenta TaxID=3075593 RepID=A0ABU3CJN8_9FLAO|nr:hypothetical protein [Zunongwangia sp. F260]MDT0646566.1 hypothetical protein [Zunongwangia sp. F260]